jgi:hypothetical protein
MSGDLETQIQAAMNYKESNHSCKSCRHCVRQPDPNEQGEELMQCWLQYWVLSAWQRPCAVRSG